MLENSLLVYRGYAVKYVAAYVRFYVESVKTALTVTREISLKMRQRLTYCEQ